LEEYLSAIFRVDNAMPEAAFFSEKLVPLLKYMAS
jgi:hypothetical protein